MILQYINVNGFYKTGPKTGQNPHGVTTARQIITRLFATHQPDLLFLAEFDLNSPAGLAATNLLAQQGYYPLYPNGEQRIAPWYTSCVVGFCRQRLTSAPSPAGALAYKWNQVQLGGHCVVGVHIPSSLHQRGRACAFWQAMCRHRSQNSHSKLIYLGDMNVFDNGTPGKAYFNRLCAHMQDGWRLCNPNSSEENGYTCLTGKRIDYALLANIGPGARVTCDQSYYQTGLTDHALLTLYLP